MIRSDIIHGEYDEEADQDDIDRMAGHIDKDPNMSGNQKNKLKEVIGLENNVKHGPWGKSFFK